MRSWLGCASTVSELPASAAGATPRATTCQVSKMRTCLILLAAVVALATATAPAQGASRLIVRGAGFGHGVGMSQYGAYGYARHGFDHAFILSHYYSGTQLGKLAGPTETRVLLRTAARITFSGVTAVAGGQTLDPAQSYVASPVLGGAVVLTSSAGRSLGTYKAPLRVTGAPAGVLVHGEATNGVNNGRYRGDLELRPGSLGMSAIDVVDLEDYVRGVVAGEMPASWPPEALQAQADAARTYAITTSVSSGAGFDQYADTRSQHYVGISGEQPSTNAAVAATAGEVVTYAGKPIVTYYFSSSGGQTENVENAFIGSAPEPWLVSVADPYDAGAPRHRWTIRMSLARATARLGGLVKGALTQIRVLQRGLSPRVVRAQVVGTGGRVAVTGPQLSAKLGLYDTWARFTVITASGVRGDGNTPKPVGGGTGGAGGPGTGGAVPRAELSITALREAAPLRVAGAIAGRVAPARAGRFVSIDRRVGRAWVAQFQTVTRAGGRFRANVPLAGLYRVRFAGAAGPAVAVG